MICNRCGNGKHKKCKKRSKTWCDCQHRVKPKTIVLPPFTPEGIAAMERLLELPPIDVSVFPAGGVVALIPGETI